MLKNTLDSIDYAADAASHVTHSRFTTGLVIGALAGAAVALLFAPTSGQKLRKQLRQGGEKLAVRARDMYSEAASSANEAISSRRHSQSTPVA